LREGKLVVFPTETVYGLGCHSRDRDTVARLYRVKGRSWKKPLAVYVASRAEVLRYVEFIPARADAVMRHFWPGPLTVLLRRPGAGGRIGFRCPDEEIALALITECGVPLAGTSANRSGCPAPVSGEEAARAMAGRADVVLKGGKTRYGRESTIVDFTGDEPLIVREGIITKAEIESVPKSTTDTESC